MSKESMQIVLEILESYTLCRKIFGIHDFTKFKNPEHDEIMKDIQNNIEDYRFLVNFGGR